MQSSTILGICTKAHCIKGRRTGFVSWQCPMMQEAEIGPSDLEKKTNVSFAGFSSMGCLREISNPRVSHMDVQILMVFAV